MGGEGEEVAGASHKRRSFNCVLKGETATSTYSCPVYTEADAAFCWCLCLQDDLYGLFLECPSQPRGHWEQMPHLLAFTGLSQTRGGHAPTQQVPACGRPMMGVGGGGTSKVISECTEVPKKELGQTSDCHSLR